LETHINHKKDELSVEFYTTTSDLKQFKTEQQERRCVKLII